MIWNTKILDFVTENLNLGIKFLNVSPFYKGNENLRKPNLKYTYTDEELALMKKYSDFMNFLEMIDHTLYKKILSHDLASVIQNNRFVCCLHYRNEDFEKISAIKLLHDLTYMDNKNFVVVSKDYNGCEKIVRFVQNYYRRMPFWLKRGIVAWNKKSIIFDNRTRLKSFRFSPNVGIGFNIDGMVTHNMVYASNKMVKYFQQTVVPIINAHKYSYIHHISTNSSKRSEFHTILEADNNYIKKIYPIDSDNDFIGNKKEIADLVGEKIFEYEYTLKIPEKNEIVKVQTYTVKIIDEKGKENVYQIPSTTDLNNEIKKLEKNVKKLNQE